MYYALLLFLLFLENRKQTQVQFSDPRHAPIRLSPLDFTCLAEHFCGHFRLNFLTQKRSQLWAVEILFSMLKNMRGIRVFCVDETGSLYVTIHVLFD